jgi:dihydroxyacetone kinase-like protein
MQRIINQPDMVVEDMLKGFVKANGGLAEATENPRVLRSAFAKDKRRVGLVTGGGSGHKPAFIGYIGKNMVDAVAVGEIFSSPTAKAFLDAFAAADSGEGVACLYGNFAGDNMNVKIAKTMAAAKGLRVETVIANDDVASAPKGEEGKRRGGAGEVLMWKAGGAKAALGGTLEEVVAAAQKAMDRTRSIGVGLTPCTIPAVGHPNFEIRPGTMEVGIGHHGEPGTRVSELKTADEIARLMVDAVVPDLPLAAGDEAAVIVSGLGATPVMELYILYGRIETLLREKGITVYRSFVGNYYTSLEMMGATFTAMKLDEELKTLLDLPCDSVGLKWGGVK